MLCFHLKASCASEVPALHHHFVCEVMEGPGLHSAMGFVKCLNFPSFFPPPITKKTVEICKKLWQHNRGNYTTPTIFQKRKEKKRKATIPPIPYNTSLSPEGLGFRFIVIMDRFLFFQVAKQ